MRVSSAILAKPNSLTIKRRQEAHAIIDEELIRECTIFTQRGPPWPREDV